MRSGAPSVELSVACVFSTGTTAFAPSGSGAPVMISQASPGAASRASSPAATEPATACSLPASSVPRTPSA
jgi:hypothetical protein